MHCIEKFARDFKIWCCPLILSLNNPERKSIAVNYDCNNILWVYAY